MTAPRALLLDFDGVLADTENVHVAAWERTFAELGWDVPPEVCARAAEVDDRALLAEVFARRNITDGDVAGWVLRKQRLAVSLLADAPRLYPGAADLVRHAQSRGKLAVVTTSWRENVATVLDASGLTPAFATIVAKEDVAADRVKPDPAAYRLALRRLKVPASEAIALEDSPSGLAAARAAKVRCIAVGHRHPAPDWAGDAPFLADLTDTRAVLESLGWGEG